MPGAQRPGDVLASRYRLVDLLNESRGGYFWRADDQVLARHVALHVIAADDDRADRLLAAARRSATVVDRRLLRVLDADVLDGICYVVNEWGSGTSLDIMLANDGPLGARRAAWIVSEVGKAIAAAHAAGVHHGRLNPENVIVDQSGTVRVIGFAVDAALHGLPEGSESADVVDLASLLYAAITGKWVGVSTSEVPAAPRENGRVLRPRQIRAGIPRALDVLCDEALNDPPASGGTHLRAPHDFGTARGITAALLEFVGDPTFVAAEEAARQRSLASAAGATGPGRPRGTSPAQPPAEEATGASGTVDHPTEAGLPIFDDDSDDVSWLNPRSDAPPPPPPFEEPPERPLFVADAPRRVPPAAPPAIPPAAVASAPAHPRSGDPYWPWDGTGAGSATGTIEHAKVPGRSWMRLAAIVATAALLLLAVVFAYQLGLGSGQRDDEPESPSPGATAEPGQPLEITGARDIDPQGDGEENPDLVGLILDGDPGTAWRTNRYNQNFGPEGLKTGLGLVLDLGATRAVGGLDVTFLGEPTGYAIYVTDRAEPRIADLTPAAEGSAGIQASIDLDEPVEGRYVVLWLTSLPQVDGGFRGEIAEVAVRG